MLDFLRRRSKIISDSTTSSILSTSEKPDADFSELNKVSPKDDLIDEIRKTFDYTQFELTRDDQGNYFGLEFDIQTTAARLKALYVREPWCYICADKIARAAASVPIKIVDAASGEKLQRHPAEIVVNGGSAFQDSVTKRWVSFLDLCLAGNAYLVMDDVYSYSVTVPTEMVTLEAKSADSFDEIVKTGPIDYAVISGFGTSSNSMKVPYQQLIHFKLPNPYNPFYGLSPFSAAARPILLDRYKNEFEMSFYHRGATHSGVVENEQEISKEKMRRLIASFEQTYTGKRNWWRPLFLPKGAKWKASTLTMSEMQHLEGLKENRLTLLAVLGIPPSQVGIVQDVNRATSEIQDKIFWQNTVIPFLNFYCAGYNSSYLFKTKYKGKIKAEPDLAGIQAVEGSLSSKGETAKAVENYLKINEIRRDILGYDELPPDDKRGEMFVKEITPNIMAGVFEPSPSPEPEPQPEPVPESSETVKSIVKAQTENISAATLAIEKALASKFYAWLMTYEDILLDQAVKALEEGRNPKAVLLMDQPKRLDAFVESALPILIDAQEKGYEMTLMTTKTIGHHAVKAKIGYEFSTEDEAAIAAIKEKTKNGKRKTLINRGINRFYGWDQNYTEAVMRMIEDGMAEGKTTAEIAKEIKTSMERRGPGEAYRDQAFTIARTETLIAVSEGIKWNNEVLGSVFTEVNKIWIHLRDEGSNEDARLDHVEFAELGEVPSDYVYESSKTGGQMKYPRDDSGGPEDVINCRCSMGNLIPKTSISRAKSIL